MHFCIYIFILYWTFFFISNRVKNFYLKSSFSIIIGILIISSSFSSFSLNGKSQLLPLLGLPVILFYYKYYIWKEKLEYKISTINILNGLLIISVCFIFNFILRLPIIENEIYFMYDDLANYSKISIDILKNKNESIFYKGFTNRDNFIPYHYLEIWLNSLCSILFSSNNYFFYVYNIQTIFISTTFLLIIGCCKEFNFNIIQKIFALFIPVLTSIPPLFLVS